MSPRMRPEPEMFFNRELSWLDFNSRVLEEAADRSNALLDRLRFASIACSNLDEFFMVRVSELKDRIAEGDGQPDPAGLTPADQLARISDKAHALVAALYKTIHADLLPELAKQSVTLVATELAVNGSSALFAEEILPSLTPLAIDTSRPFPMLANLSLNVAVLLAPSDGEEPRLAVVQVPSRLPRLFPSPGAEGPSFVWTEELIRANLPALFPGQKILESTAFRITRDSGLDLDDEGGLPYVEAILEELKKRRRSGVVRLEVLEGVSGQLLAIIAGRLKVREPDVYRVPGPVDPRGFDVLQDRPELQRLRGPAHRPQDPPETETVEDLFALVSEGDLLFHHPYDAFEPICRFVSQAADDPGVLAIKMTLYRTSGDSPIATALARAAENGKQVTAIVELMARFDEDSNIRWARRLEEAGAHVIYGVRGLKTHAKICLVVRREPEGIRRYVHLGTGNYNDRTARLYTDIGLMTADPRIGEDASGFFNALTGYSDPPRMRRLVMAPIALRRKFLELIRRETRRAESGQAGEITAKMNSLVDPEIIRALYAASAAGVKIRLNVRGTCCLRPGKKGLSDTIEVVSILDRFLEHARVFRFRNGGDEEVYLSSADWMARNLDRRIELLFPVEQPALRRRVVEGLEAMFRDNVKARRLGADGSWRRLKPAHGEEPFRVQAVLADRARARGQRAREEALGALEPLERGETA